MSTITSTQPSAPVRNLRWRTVDITVTAVVAVASGVIFWGAGLISEPLSALFQFVPGMSALTWGLFYFAGPLAAIIVRKPGAALFAELIAGVVEAFLGSHWGGLGTILPGLIQGLGSELVFLAVAYKTWNLAVTTLSGAAAGLAGMAVSWVVDYQGYAAGFIIVSFVCSIVSGAIIAGALMWLLFRMIARTGALASLASGHDAGSRA
ncbi:ECF transporter S component [Bifidobacterium mongoliense]|uniref:ECF transporter S component n=1 Tax=Bifidobacterium mongoliense TaxID=518643 RepID=UPI0030F48A90